jgi:hypothetical protein
MNIEENGYSINYEMVLKSPDVSSVTKLLAQKLMENPYYSVGEFLQSISTPDLQALCARVDGDDANYSDVILMGEMLATAEGLDQSKGFDGFESRANHLVGFLTIESLKRKGLVKVYYENISFGDDQGDKIVVERIYE